MINWVWSFDLDTNNFVMEVAEKGKVVVFWDENIQRWVCRFFHWRNNAWDIDQGEELIGFFVARQKMELLLINHILGVDIISQEPIV